MSNPPKTAIIIGAGPAGLTAAYELLTRTSIKPIVLESSDHLGGIARTINYKGNRIDIGGHRFFSKSDRVMDWWLRMLPLEELEADRQTLSYQRQRREIDSLGQGPDPRDVDRVMLLRQRRSRIYFLRRFFDYPISLTVNTLRQLGPARTIAIGLSYLRAMLFPIRDEKNLEEFFINRFGRRLYETFFKSYTEKVWGRPCREISAEWGAQRIKGLSIVKAILDAVKRPFRGNQSISQKSTETSLIERFLYPKLGPGQMWEEVAQRVINLGGEIHMLHDVHELEESDGRVRAVIAHDKPEGASRRFEGDYVFSTMPMKHLVRALGDEVPEAIKEIGEGLVYRDFITVGLLVNKMKIHEEGPNGSKLIRDNWIYIQEPDVQVGRLQIFNNWSPYLVADPEKVWLGLEYFCDEADDLWKLPDDELIALAKAELAHLDIIDRAEVVDATVIRVPKTYPAYFGTYDRIDELRDYLDRLENLFLVGRNGMHRYNNQDHSMLTAMVAVDNIVVGRTDKRNIWEVNTEREYHEQRQPNSTIGPRRGHLPPTLTESATMEAEQIRSGELPHSGYRQGESDDIGAQAGREDTERELTTSVS
ncbi:hypothetical protein Pan216_51630 [Planctomycetes bacterium Pan216]|uniref:Amine oxidase domain-containing protein n=1 Tax=Kolteria novifilia TaxID=2527975 RepID=A0A518BBA6_9BACT|nr:hypothetical protein Pan216_51630 [Planctomycetes bacterium Pan216]